MTPAQTKIIRHKSLMLASALSARLPEDRMTVAEEVTRIVDAFPSQDAGKVAGSMRALAYLEALADAPPWAVVEARKDIFAARTPFGKPFGPGPVELAELVREITRPYRNDMIALGGLLRIAEREDPDPEIKEMIADGFDALKIELGDRAHAAVRHDPTDDELRQAALKHLGNYPRVKPKGSDGAEA